MGYTRRVRVFISADIEGCTGLVSWSQCSRPDGNSYDYPFARRMMTHDVNAAIRGAKRAGAETIVVKDSHGNSKNLLVDELEPGIRLISGHGNSGGAHLDGMVQGISSDFDALFLVGYHAMAGTPNGIMEHTITGGIHRLWLNGVEAGEIALAAYAAGQYHVPLALVTSCAAGCAEAVTLAPEVKAVSVKNGFARYMGRCLPPEETGEMIEDAAFHAVAKMGRPNALHGPVEVRAEFNRTEQADLAARLPEVVREDGYTVKLAALSFTEAHRLVWLLVELSQAGLAVQH